jgi:outer membrane protein OmpA-like peptidoglycan-associated protein
MPDMNVKTPATATAMALVLGLSGPLPAAAQDRPACTVDVDLPCVTDTGAVVETQEELDIYIERFPAEAEEAAGEAGAVPASSDAEAAAELPQCAEGAEVPCVTAEGAVVETEVELQSYLDAFPAEADDGGDPAAADDAADGGAPDAEGTAAPDAAAEQDGSDVEPEAAGDPEPAAPEAPEEAAGEEPAEEAAPEAATSETAPAEDEAPDAAAQQEPAEEAPADGDAATVESDATDAAGEEPAEEAAPEAAASETAPAEAEAPDATAEQETADDAPPAPTAESDPAAGEAAPAPAEAPAAAPDTAEAPAAPEAAGTVEADIPEVESEVPPAAAAAAEDAVPSGEVEETTVTEETARSATEEFETVIGEEPAPAARDEEDGEDGLSTLQRVIAAGLAGAAIGALTGDGGEVVANTGDRLVVRDGAGDLRVLRDENALLRQPGARVRTETFDDGSTRTTVIREDGSEIVTIRAAEGRVLRRTRILPDGERVVLFDDTRGSAPVDVATLPAPAWEAVEYTGDEAALRAALSAAMAQDVGRSFSLEQIREIRAVRELAPEIEIDAITFATGSAAIRPEEAEQLAVLGRTITAMIEENPAEVFLVEGHTDAVGDATYNLALSDRRAETVALALAQFFEVPPENLVVQGYGESDLKVPTAGAEVANRRVNVRLITPLLGAETAFLR